MNRLLLLLLFMLSSASFLFAQKAEQSYDLLWKVEGNELSEASYLFGTMHVKDERAFNFSDSVMLAIESTDAFANEVHFEEIIGDFFEMMFDEDTSNSIQNILSEEEYEKLAEKVEQELGIPLDRLNLKNPFFLDLMIGQEEEEGGRQMGTFVDGHLLGIAKTLGKNIYGLEELEDQMEIFSAISLEDQRETLLKIIDEENSENEKQTIEEMITLYESGNLKALENLMGSEIMNDPILIKRNHVMVNSIIEISKKESLFAAVGAAHLPGKEGLVELLRDKGYTVSLVQAKFTGVASNYKVDVDKMKWETYRNEEWGIELETPGKMADFNAMEGISSVMYPDLTSGLFYVFVVIPLPVENSSPEYEELIISDMLKQEFTNDGDKILESRRVEIEDGSGIEMVVEKEETDLQLMRYFVRGNKLLGVTIAGQMDQIKSPSAQRFLNSFKYFGKEEANAESTNADGEWITTFDEKCGCSFKTPGKPEFKPIEGDEILAYQYQLLDPVSMNSFFVQYNDFPMGQYLMDVDAAYEGALENWQSIGEILKLDTIIIDGYEGRSAELMIKNSFAKVNLVARGNRLHIYMQNNLVKGQSFINDQGFLDNFKFEESGKDRFELIESADKSFRASLPSINRPVKEAELESFYTADSYMNFVNGWYGKNAFTGGVYILFESDFSAYFKAEKVDSFLVQYFNDYVKECSDTLLNTELKNLANGVQTYDVFAKDKYTDLTRRMKFVLSGKNLYQMLVFETEKLINGELVDQFFDSFELVSPEDPYDFTPSKTDLILSNLKSDEIDVFEEAVGAFSYYVFDSLDVSALMAALKYDYLLDTGTLELKNLIYNDLSLLVDDSKIDDLVEIYKQNKDYPLLPNSILESIAFMETEKSMEVYTNLLFNDPPIEHVYTDLYLFSDSIQLFEQHFDELIKFLDDEKRKSYIIRMCSYFQDDKNPKVTALINGQVSKLIKSAPQEFKDYKSKMNGSEEEYISVGNIGDYLSIVANAEETEIGKNLSEDVLSYKKSTDYLKELAMIARIKQGWKYSNKQMLSLLEKKYHRIDVMEALAETGQSKKIPVEYRKQDSFAKYAFSLYVDEDYPADDYVYLGKVEDEMGTYYVYKFLYNDEEGYDYIGIIGPFEKEGEKINYDYSIFVDWSGEKIEDWQERGAALLKGEN